MTHLLKTLSRLGHSAKTLAADCYPRGATLTCTSVECRATQYATTEECARYLARGWPRHCDQAMRVEAR